MHYVEQDVRLAEIVEGFADPDVISQAIKNLPLAARAAANMAVEGTGQHVGRPTKWASQIGDLRFAAAEPDRGDMVLRFMVPPLGDAAPHLYEQGDFWKSPPAPTATALDLLMDAVVAVRSLDRESDMYDQFVLKRLKALGPVLHGADRIALCGRDAGSLPVEIDSEVFRSVVKLQRATPDPVAVRLVGKLDMIRASTRAFALLLENRSEITGVFRGDPSELKDLFHQKVFVVGKLLYRPSGAPLRLDAEVIAIADGQSRIWEKLPEPPTKSLQIADLHRRQGPTTGISAIFGAWPGDEDDDVVERELARLS